MILLSVAAYVALSRPLPKHGSAGEGATYAQDLIQSLRSETPAPRNTTLQGDLADEISAMEHTNITPVPEEFVTEYNQPPSLPELHRTLAVLKRI